MSDEVKTREQLINELAELCQRIAELEASEVERVQTKKSPSLLDESYQRLLELSPIGVTVLDMKGVTVYCNPAVCMKSGYSKDDFVGKHFSKASTIRAGDIPKFMKVFASLIRGKTPKPFEAIYQRKDGTTGWTELHIGLIRVGGKRRILVMQHDITERKQAEIKIGEVQERFSGIFNSSKDAIGFANPEGVLLDVNDAFCQLTGYSKKELLSGRKYQDITPKEYEEYEAKIIKRIVTTGKPEEYKKEYTRKDGSRVPILLTVFVVKGPDGKPIGVAAIIKDVTERKRAEEALRESEEKYRALVENSPNFVAIYQDGYFKYVNKATCEKLGWTYEELTSPSHDPVERLLQSKSCQETVRQNIAKRLRGKYIPPYELALTTRDGSKLPVIIYAQRILYHGKPADQITLVDITERKQTEEALLESEERYRSLVNLGGAVGEAIVMLQDTEQGDAIHTFVSKEWPRITGYSKKELLGMSFFDLLHPKYHEAALKRHKRRMRGETISKLFEMSIIRKDGTEVPIELTSAYTRYKREYANVVFIRDITERKEAEERERRLQQELHLSSRLASIGELAAGVAHEINNPLTGIMGYSEILLRKPADEKTKKGLEIIHSSSLRAAKIVQNLLTFARRHQPKKEYADINKIVKEALELRAYELKTSNIEVALNLASDLPQIMGDFYQIQEVFLNLILNAEQAMSEAHGRGKLIIKTKQLKDRVRVSFSDDGSGIPTEHLNKLFDPFFSTREEKGGTGLGLSICHGIMEEHGGKIYAKSKLGKGTTLFVELPLTT